MENNYSYLQEKVFELESRLKSVEAQLSEQKNVNQNLADMIKDLTRYDMKETDLMSLLKKKIEENRQEVIELTHTINNITKVIKSLEGRC